SRNNPKHAGEEFKAAADLSPVRSGERIKYAEFQAANGAVNDAKISLQNITRQAPDFAPAWRLLAQIAATEKKYDESLSMLENIFNRDPENPDARVLESEVWLSKGDATKPIAVFDLLYNPYRDAAVVKYQLARAYLKMGNSVQATVALEQAIAANPNYTEAVLVLAALNLRSGKPQPVIIAMEDLVKKRPDLPQARIMLANAYQASGRLDEAAALFR